MAEIDDKINLAISWMTDRLEGTDGAVDYSMEDRYGPSSYDCSSSVDAALTGAGIWPEDGPDNTDSMHADFEKIGWQLVPQNAEGGYDTQRGDVFIWGVRGQSTGAFGHTGILVDTDNIVHCNYAFDGITINNHDYIWSANGCPQVYFYRHPDVDVLDTDQVFEAKPIEATTAAENSGEYYTVQAGDTLSGIAAALGMPGKMQELAEFNGIVNVNLISAGQKIYKPGSAPEQRGELISYTGVFVPNQTLPVSADTDPESEAVAEYEAGQAINYDSYIVENGYCWISYIGGSGLRRYVAVGPDDGRTDTTYGHGFFND